MRRSLGILGVLVAGCGGVKKVDEDPCKAFCDHSLDDCGTPMSRTDCDFICACFHDGVVEEVSDDFIECISELPCDAQNPELICSLTVGGRVEPTQYAHDAVIECETKIQELGGECRDASGEVFDCGFAYLLVDDVLTESLLCTSETNCDDFVACLQNSLINYCIGPVG